MKRPGRFLVCAAVFATLGLVAVGCGKPPAVGAGEPTPPSPQVVTKCDFCDRTDQATKENTITVLVRIENGVAKTDTKFVPLCLGVDNVEWVAATGDLQLPDFGKSAPWDAPPDWKPGKKIKSPKAKNEGKFDYKLMLVDNGKTYELDPRIEVMK